MSKPQAFTADEFRSVAREICHQFGRLADNRSDFLIGKKPMSHTGVVATLGRDVVGSLKYIQFEFVTRDKIRCGARLQIDKLSANPHTYIAEFMLSMKAHIDQRRAERQAEGPIDLSQITSKLPARIH